MEGSWVLLGLAMAVVLFASLGWGFVISGLSANDSQAVQYSMMVLLASFFFSGFVLSLQTLSQPVRVVSRILPATYGIAFAQDIMLRGEGIDPVYGWSVLGLALALMLFAWLLVRRNLRRARP
jgi:ABC-2 type transport system permease protein